MKFLNQFWCASLEYSISRSWSPRQEAESGEMQRALIAPRPRISEGPYSVGVYPTMQLLRRWLIPWHYHQIDLQLCTFGGKYHCVASVRMLLGLNIAISACSAACQVYKVSQQTNWSYLPMCISTPGSFRVRDVHMVNIMQTITSPISLGK